MPRPTKPARLYWRKDKGQWSIVDGRRQVRLGTADRREAQAALAEYLATDGRQGGPDQPGQVSIAAVLDRYGSEHAPTTAAPERIGYALGPLIEFWGDLPVSAVTGNTCRRYAAARDRSAGTVRRELGVLRAAINYSHQEGYLTLAPAVTLPERPAARERWLTRAEAAALLRSAKTDPRSRHLVWFTLISLYTGTRKQAVLSLRFTPHTLGGWIDCEAGVIHRAGSGQRKTGKRKPPVRMPAKLLGHMRRRQASGATWAVEYKGGRVLDVKRAFARACADAGLEGVTPHTLKHTAVTWAMQRGVPLADAAGYFGTSIQTLEAVYLHHHPDFMKATAAAMDRQI